MKRFDVLDRNTRVFGQYFLEASAGTGKTFAIENIAVRALIESEDPLSIEQVLIVTFTRAATRELKVRLRGNLAKTLVFLQNGSGGPDYLRPVFERGPEAVFSAIRKIEEALCKFDQAAIFTLHGFCHKMLSEFAFEAGTFFEITPPDSSSHSEQVYQVAEDFLRAGLERAKYSPSQIEGVLKGSTIEGLCKKMVAWIEKGVFIPKTAGFKDLLQEFQSHIITLQEKYPLDGDGFLQDFELLSSCYKRIQESHRAQVAGLAHILKNGQVSYEDFDTIIGTKEYFLSLLTDDNLKKGKDPKKLALRHGELFTQLVEKLLPVIERASHPEKNFLRLVEDCMQKWKASPQYEESFSPDDLLRKMVDALQKPGLKEKISKKYPVGIIDEFQDTDPLQWQIFKGLFLEESASSKTIYLVGDPKQSIYAFRSADVYTYRDAMHNFAEENRLVLDTNYRSEPSLVKALNTLFTKRISKDWMQLPSSGEFLDLHQVQAREPFPKKEEKKERQSIHFMVAEGSSGRGRKWPSEGLEQDQFFPFIVSEISRMTKEEGYLFGQFAVLVRDRFQAARLELYMKEQQVPCSVKRAFSLEESIAYLALHDLIRAVISPDDCSALKKVLGGALLGMNAHELIGGMELNCLQDARLYFQMARGLVTKMGWGAFFSHFFSSVWNQGEKTVLEDILSRRDTRLYFELRQLIQVVLEGSAEMLYSLEGFYSFFTDLAHLDGEDDILKVAAESEEDQVIVMTIHASKGLEFSIVFALGLASRSSGGEDIVRTKEEGKETLTIWDPSSGACIQSVLEADAEKMRHLYVALTRAKTRVYIPLAIDTDRRSLSLSQASSIELLCQSFGKERFDLLKAYESIHEYTLAELIEHISLLGTEASIGYTILSRDKEWARSAEAPAEDKEFFFAESFSPVFTSKKILSFTALQHLNEMSSSVSNSLLVGTEQIPETEIPLGAATGTCLHRILELIFKEGLHLPYQEESIRRLIFEQTSTTNLKGWEDQILHLIKRVLNAPLLENEDMFCFSDVGSDQFYLEMEFAYAFEGHMLKGFIDAVFFWKDKYYVVDWKSNFLGSEKTSYSRDAIGQAMESQGYFLQAAIYTEALKRYLAQTEKRDFESCFGGVFYVFVRQGAVYHFYPDPSLLSNINHQEEALCKR